MSKKTFTKEMDICYLRIFSTICVVWLHTSSTLVDNREHFALSEGQYAVFSFLYQIMYWAVPVFFMMTGAVLLGRQTSYIECVNKYIKRIFLALVIFGIPFAGMKLIMQTNLSKIGVLWNAVLAVVEGNSFGHLWYLYVLIGIYLILPVLQIVVKNVDVEIKYLLFFLFVFDFLLPTFGEVIGINIAFSVPVSWPVFYLLLGYYLNNRCVNVKNNSVLCGGLIISIILLLGILNYTGYYSKELSSYNSPVIVVMSVAVFLLFKKLKDRQFNETVWKIDRLCFTVYLVHPLFIHFVYRFLKITPILFEGYYLSVIIFFIIFVIVSFVAAWVLNKIPFLHKYVL